MKDILILILALLFSPIILILLGIDEFIIIMKIWRNIFRGAWEG